MLKLHRVYAHADRADGRRILVDRLWPRGLSKKEAKFVASESRPSTGRRTYHGNGDRNGASSTTHWSRAADSNARPSRSRSERVA
ncbi:MAG: DUF488 family protein, N3 subclade [Gemmatimonadaceae bacterium]